MPRLRKPPGWPRYMIARTLRDGSVAFYWQLPKKYRIKGCPLHHEPLGVDYALAKEKCDLVLNPQFYSWLTGSEQQTVTGTLIWMCAEYQKSRKFRELSERTQKDYRISFNLINEITLSNTKLYLNVGCIPLTRINYAAADRIYDRLCEKPGGGKRITTANKAIRAIRRAWNVVHRIHPSIVPSENPFHKMGLKNTNRKTIPANRAQLMRFVEAADKLEVPSVGIAALITFEWLLREKDIIGCFSWSDYRSEIHPFSVILRHSKTSETIVLPLEDENGLLYPELTMRIEALQRRGPLVILRDTKDRKLGEYLPYKEDWFRHTVAKIRDHAGLPKDITFTSFRHGGLTELGDAGLTDQSMMALSAHKTRDMLTIYSKRNERQRSSAARKRLIYRSEINAKENK